MSTNPLDLLLAWRDAAAAEPEPDAMTLATADASGCPSARIVLFRGIRRGRVCFFTNYLSKKGQDLAANPRAALVFHWPSLHRQIRLEGEVERLTAEESDAYFASRPRGHQLGAWASEQSQTIAGLEIVRQRLAEAEERFRDRPVERPSHWGGFGLDPKTIEFWTAGADRIHDREVYRRGPDGAWILSRLSP
ncbi:MAG: pyridoxamine 5'-phosphate oxidase [Myxococcota bacterium]